MGQMMYGMFVALAVAASPGGCQSVPDKLAESDPSPGKVVKRETLIDRDVPKGDSCELKSPSGTGQCEDGRHAIAKNETASKKSNRALVPSDCTAFGLRGYVLLAQLGHRMSEWKAYCASGPGQSSDASASGEQAPAAGDDSQGGTWFCEDSVDGSGNYGTLEMTRQTDRFYDCKQVN